MPLDIEIASQIMRPSCEEPSQPGSKYINCISGAQTPNTFVIVSTFLDLYLLFNLVGTVTFTCVPSNGPK